MPDQMLPFSPPGTQIPVGVPSIYCNGFTVGLTNTDVSLILMIDNQPQLNLHLSFTTAKTLALGLAQTIEHLEKIAERSIMLSTEIAEAVARQAKPEAE